MIFMGVFEEDAIRRSELEAKKNPVWGPNKPKFRVGYVIEGKIENGRVQIMDHGLTKIGEWPI